MFLSFKISRAKKKAHKLQVEIAGIEAELLGIDAIIKRTHNVTFGQSNRVAELSRHLGKRRKDLELTRVIISDLDFDRKDRRVTSMPGDLYED